MLSRCNVGDIIRAYFVFRCNVLANDVELLCPNLLVFISLMDLCRYERLNDLKKLNRDLKTLLSVDGRGMGESDFVTLLSSDENRREFAETTTSLLRQRNFDGFNVEFPNAISHEVALFCGVSSSNYTSPIYV